MAIGKGNEQMNTKIGLEKLQHIEEFTYLGVMDHANKTYDVEMGRHPRCLQDSTKYGKTNE